jgi:hypothetical protein
MVLLARVIPPAARWILVAALLATPTGGASAAAPPEVLATAERLYQDAYALALDGKHARACKLYEESDKLDPANGTKLELAKCYEKTQRPASAWALYVTVADGDRATGRNRTRETQARARAKALEASLPRLVLMVSEGARRIPSLRITRNGVPVGEALWGTAMPVDLGKHAIRASAAGNWMWKGEGVVSRMGETVTVTMPDPPSAQGGAAPIAALTLAGVGLTGFVVGSVCGGLAFAKWGEVEDMAQDQCNDPLGLSGCTPAVADKGAEASRYATASTAGFIAGGVGLAAGAVLWFVSSSGKRPASGRIEILPLAGREGVGTVVRGSF